MAKPQGSCWVDKKHDEWDPTGSMPERMLEFYTNIKLTPHHEGGGAIKADPNGRIQTIAIRLPKDNGKRGRKIVFEFTLREAWKKFSSEDMHALIAAAGLRISNNRP
jgi:hypothetical protein